MKQKLFTVTIGIPAYNAQDNIINILTSLASQVVKKFRIDSIVLFSDNSTDGTVNLALKLKQKVNILRIIEGKKRKGFPLVFKNLVRNIMSDAFILFNDDILIRDKYLLYKLIKPFLEFKNVGLVSGNPQPLTPKNFIESAGVSTFRAYEKARYLYKKGQNKFTCDAKVLALSKSFLEVLRFPQDDKKMGNVDSFLYFSCKLSGFKYMHIRNVVVHFSYPSKLSEYIQWSIRNNQNQYLLQTEFGEEVKKEYVLPKKYLYPALAYQFAKSPIQAAFIYIVGLYCKVKAVKEYRDFNPVWDVIKSTKRKLRYEKS